MKLFVWDFHGVLETGNEKAVIEITNMVLEEFGYSERLSIDDCERYYGYKWFEYFQNMLPNESHEEHIRLQSRSFQISDSHPEIVAKYIKQNLYAQDVLNTIAQKHHQILISNTHHQALHMFIKSIKVETYFNEANTFAADAHQDGAKKSKKDILNDFINNSKIEYDEIITIGDSEGDITMVEDYPNSKSYLYAHSNRQHKDVNATYKIRDLRDLLKEL